ncbi:hypothetical protein FE257_006748 [Aspergillus nanangensis]|uniref:Uncharacterized protein n=1 Tax=Aspergillus nanangensis TaxID=2582783 RepID=A0AAD4GW19_ASPNN|nr:hypothetical protein FE257_006748 [Aspergillus nanangensis]
MLHSPLPSIHRVVTSHNDQGQAVISYNNTLPASILPHRVAEAILWTTDSSPADVNSPDDKGLEQVGFLNGGSILRIVDLPPRTASMHQWDNETDEWAQILCVMAPARTPEFGGQTLETDLSFLS